MRLKAVVLNRAGIDPEMTRGGRAGVEGLECCPQGLVLFFPDAEEILGVWKNLLMFIEAAVGGIGHRIEAGPKVGIQKKKTKLMKAGPGAVGAATGPDSTESLRA